MTESRVRRTASNEQVVLACGVGIVVVFVVSLFGKPIYGIPVLAAPLVYIILRHSLRDVTAVLTVYVGLLIFVPSVLIFEPLGASGTPANVLGIAMLWWWLLSRYVLKVTKSRDRSPIRSCIAFFGLSVMASYAALAFRPIVPEELSAADRGLLFFAGCAGIALLASDGIESRARLDTLLRRLVAAGAALGLLGLYQFITGFDVNEVLSVPGLTQNQHLNTLISRSSFERVAGTAAHPIEFGVVMAVLFPIALHYALFASEKTRWRWWTAVGLIALGIPLSLSRSAVVTVAVALLVLMPTWPRRWIARAVGLGVGFIVALQFAIPGLLDAVTQLFVNIGSDESTSGRTQDYVVVMDTFRRTPILGRGFFTYLPDVYRTLDNQYLLSLLEIGLVGLGALIALLLAGMSAGRAARKAATDAETRHLGQALAASIAAAAVSFATFDALSFPMAAGLVFLLIGAAGGLRRVVRSGPLTVGAPAAPQAASTSVR